METFRYARLPRPSSLLPPRVRQNTPLPLAARLSVQAPSLLPYLTADDKQTLRFGHTLLRPAPLHPGAPIPSLTHCRALCGGAPYRPERALPVPAPPALGQSVLVSSRAQPISARLSSQNAPRPRGLSSRVPARAKVAALGGSWSAAAAALTLIPTLIPGVCHCRAFREGLQVDGSRAQLGLLARFPLCVS